MEKVCKRTLVKMNGSRLGNFTTHHHLTLTHIKHIFYIVKRKELLCLVEEEESKKSNPSQASNRNIGKSHVDVAAVAACWYRIG